MSGFSKRTNAQTTHARARTTNGTEQRTPQPLAIEGRESGHSATSTGKFSPRATNTKCLPARQQGIA
eukprot:1586125-Lingulodinium_polyedra.AAC.1